MSLWRKIGKIDRYIKRGFIYIFIGVLGMMVELFWSHDIDSTVLILWLGVIGIGIIVMVYLKDPGRKK